MSIISKEEAPRTSNSEINYVLKKTHHDYQRNIKGNRSNKNRNHQLVTVNETRVIRKLPRFILHLLDSRAGMPALFFAGLAGLSRPLVRGICAFPWVWIARCECRYSVRGTVGASAYDQIAPPRPV